MFKKLTQFAGFVGIEVQVDINREVSKEATQIEGTIRVTATQDQSINKVKIEMYQVKQEGSGSDHKTDKQRIGDLMLNQPFDIKKGETKEIPFVVPFQRQLSLKKKMSEQGGVMGLIGKAYSYSENERYDYWIEATVDVKGAAADPQGTQSLYFV